MATYIALTSFTDQGIRNARDTTKRADAVKELARKFGATAKEFYWTLGRYDVVAIFDAPDDASMTALGLAIGAMGNVRTQTLRAFSREEMKGVLAKLA
ncbi:MAG TPA: GYD domain-containing protein [Casimicrobiaceae bacterium]